MVERLALEAAPVHAQPGETVVAEGDPGDRFFVIAQGRVQVTREDRLLRELVPGEWFGELALLRDVPRTATVTAETEVSLWAVGRDTSLPRSARPRAPGSWPTSTRAATSERSHHGRGQHGFCAPRT